MTAATVTAAEPSSSNIDMPNSGLTIADAVWVGMALLHYRRPAQDSFPKQEIVDSVLAHALTKADIKSIKQHVNQHCVANCKPQPNRSRMLYATSETHRRLFFDGDRYDPARQGSPTHPEWVSLPAEYAHLREWYESFRLNHPAPVADDPLLALIGAGSDIWKHEHADEYVANLRSNWGDAR